jgi:hypothetical protein
MSYFKERIPDLIEKLKNNIDYLESIIEEDFSQEAIIEKDEIKLTIKDEKILNVIRAKKEAREELMKCYNEVERLESIHSGKDQEKDTTNLHPTKRYASQ